MGLCTWIHLSFWRKKRKVWYGWNPRIFHLPLHAIAATRFDLLSLVLSPRMCIFFLICSTILCASKIEHTVNTVSTPKPELRTANSIFIYFCLQIRIVYLIYFFPRRWNISLLIKINELCSVFAPTDEFNTAFWVRSFFSFLFLVSLLHSFCASLVCNGAL